MAIQLYAEEAQAQADAFKATVAHLPTEHTMTLRTVMEGQGNVGGITALESEANKVASAYEQIPVRAQKGLNTLNESMNSSAGVTETAARRVETSAGSMESSLMSHVGGAAGKVKDQVTSALGMFVPLAAGAAAVALGRMAVEFDTSTTQLVTGAGESVTALAGVKQAVLDMAGVVGDSPLHLSQGLYQIESAGYHGAAGLQVLKTAEEGAKVGAANSATMADALTSALNAYHLPATDAAKVTNDLIATVASGKMHMEDLAGSIGHVLPAAAAAHVSLAELSGAIATMTMQGTPAADAATYLRQTILQLSNPTQKARDEMTNLGLSADDISQHLGQRGLTGTLQILTDAIKAKMGPAGEVLIQNLAKVAKSGGDMQAALDSLPKSQQTYIAALADMVGGTKSMQAALELTGPNLQTFKDNVNNISGAVSSSGDQVKGWGLIQQDTGQKMSQAWSGLEASVIKVFGESLLPYLSQFSDWVSGHMPEIQAGMSTALHDIGAAFQFVAQHADLFKAIIEILVIRWGALKAMDIVGNITGLGNSFRNAVPAVQAAGGAIEEVGMKAKIASVAGNLLSQGLLIGVGMLATEVLPSLIGGIMNLGNHMDNAAMAVQHWHDITAQDIDNAKQHWDDYGKKVDEMGSKSSAMGKVLQSTLSDPLLYMPTLTKSFGGVTQAIEAAANASQHMDRQSGQVFQTIGDNAPELKRFYDQWKADNWDTGAAINDLALKGYSAFKAMQGAADQAKTAEINDAYQAMQSVITNKHLTADQSIAYLRSIGKNGYADELNWLQSVATQQHTTMDALMGLSQNAAVSVNGLSGTIGGVYNQLAGATNQAWALYNALRAATTVDFVMTQHGPGGGHAYATGGIVRGGSFLSATVGELEDEAIIPKSKAGPYWGMIGSLLRGNSLDTRGLGGAGPVITGAASPSTSAGGGPTVVLQVTGNTIMDDRSLDNLIDRMGSRLTSTILPGAGVRIRR